MHDMWFLLQAFPETVKNLHCKFLPALVSEHGENEE